MKSMKIPPEEDLRLRMIQLISNIEKEDYLNPRYRHQSSNAERTTDAILAFLKKEPIR